MAPTTFTDYQKANCTEHRLTQLLGGGWVCLLCWTTFQCPDCGDFTPTTTDCCGVIRCGCHTGRDHIDDTIAVCLVGYGCAEQPPNGGIWADDPWLIADEPDTLYVYPCIVCGERTGFDTDQQGSCWPCTPHVCTPELPEDTWCDICGKDI